MTENVNVGGQPGAPPLHTASVKSVHGYLSANLASRVLRGVDVYVRPSGGHRAEHVGEVHPATRVAGVGAGEGALNLALGAHRSRKEGDADGTVHPGHPTMDVSG